MKDTPNRKRYLREAVCFLSAAQMRGDRKKAAYWQDQVQRTKKQLAQRRKNQRKNRKEFKKANGYYLP